MSSQKWNSSGLDKCWPTFYPAKYASYDLNNSGHRGLPSSYVGVKYNEVIPPMAGIAHLLEVNVPQSVVLSNVNYFPVAGRESLPPGGTIPEGAILHLRSLSLIPDSLSAAARTIAQALYYYGAVVSDTNSLAPAQAYLNVEAVYIEGDPSKNWNNLGVHRDSLAGIPFDVDHFEFLKKGAPDFPGPGGPNHDDWIQMDCENQPDP
jgi:hypothetical protein